MSDSPYEEPLSGAAVPTIEGESDTEDRHENDDEDTDEDTDEETDVEINVAPEAPPGGGIEVLLTEDADDNGELGVQSVRLVQPDGQRVDLQMSRAQTLEWLDNAGLRRILIPGNVRSGRYGGIQRRRPAAGIRRRPPLLPHQLLAREFQTDPNAVNRLIAQGLIPCTKKAETIIHHDQACYSGQFSDDGNFFFSCSQDFVVRMYDTSNPHDWRHYKSVDFINPRWTITDATLSPDNRFLAFSSIRDHVCLVSTDPADTRRPAVLNFSMPGQTSLGIRFAIWSVKFSGDGRELVAGTGDHSVYVFDLERNQSILRIPAHTKDVNTVCWSDQNSPHIIYSGSDDGLLKVWDRRSLHDGREAGVFIGHTEGITYAESEGDGTHVLSNGKDQTMKLWDIRRLVSADHAAEIRPQRYCTGFDYRYNTFSALDYHPNPYDIALATYRGHSVLRTLIRCHFSPRGSTDSKYLYTGSQDGKVYIYNREDTEIAGIIDVDNAIRGEYSDARWKAVVRDAAWHPHAPMIAATSWGRTRGACTVHSWPDGEDDSGIEMPRRVNSEMRPDSSLYQPEARMVW